MAVIGSLSVKLGLVTVEWDKATTQAKQQAKALQKSFEELTGGVKKLQEGWKALGGAVSASSIGFAALMQQTAAFTDDIVDMSKAFGLSVQETMAFRDALIIAGSSAESASRGVSSLFSKIEEARQGNDPVIAQFEQLGISFAELKTMSPYEAIQKVADGLADVGNEFERVKTIKDFFGKAGIGLNMDDLSKALQKGSQGLDKYAQSIEKFSVLQDNIQRSFNNLKIAFADLTAPFVRDLVIGPEKFSQILKSIVAVAVLTGLAKIVQFTVAFAAAIREATVAATIFNATAGGASPIGLMLKVATLGAVGFAFLPKPESLAVSENLMSKQLDRDAEIEKSEKEQEKVLSKQAAIRAQQVAFMQSMLALDLRRNALQEQSVYGDTAALDIEKNRVDLQQKLAEIENKRKTKLTELGDQATVALKEQIDLESQLEAKRARNDAASKERQIRRRADYEDMKNRLASYGNIGADIEQEGMAPQALRDAADARAQAIKDFRFVMSESVRLTDLANERLNYEMAISDLLPRQKELLLEEYDLEQKIADYRTQAKRKGETDAAIELTVSQMREAGQETIRLKRLTQEQQRTFEYGWKKAFDSFVDDSTNAAKVAEDMFSSIVSNMDAALSNFVRTGKMSFKDLTRSIIQDLLLIQMRAQMSGIFRMFGSFFGGNPIGASGYSDMATFNSLMAAGGLANGGSIGANEPHLVGERGPELFMPKNAGTIIPNERLGGLGNTTNVTNYNINAIDVKSFEERIMGSSNAVWAANLYAQKRLPLGAGRM